MTKSDILTEITNAADSTLPSSGNVTSAQINEFANRMVELMITTTKTVNPDTKPYPSVKF